MLLLDSGASLDENAIGLAAERTTRATHALIESRQVLGPSGRRGVTK
jgi:hypothetical protein